jgi:hypothetical protein
MPAVLGSPGSAARTAQLMQNSTSTVTLMSMWKVAMRRAFVCGVSFE